jgi:succinyl-CoA synthetase alpha subunit
VDRVFQPGPVGVISKSGGMTSELSSILTQAGIGQSTALGIGGDVLVGSDFADIMELFEEDPSTKVVVLFGEVGGTFEEQAAQMVLEKRFTKPVVAFVAGKFSRDLPQGTTLGHAGAIVSEGKGGWDSKMRLLKKAGVHLPETLEDLAPAVHQILGKKTSKLRKARV